MIKICYRYAGDTDGAGVIFNNAMLRVFKNMNTYRHEGKLIGWVKTIVVNCCLDFIKNKNKFNNETFSGEIEELPGNDTEIQDFVSAKDIRKIISGLPRATAAVFNLYAYEGFTHKQISGSLGISEGTSKWHVNEARKRLAISLKEFITP
jgi:RNA polymerase sigma-70 factor (ECF subfamily)